MVEQILLRDSITISVKIVNTKKVTWMLAPNTRIYET